MSFSNSCFWLGAVDIARKRRRVAQPARHAPVERLTMSDVVLRHDAARTSREPILKRRRHPRLEYSAVHAEPSRHVCASRFDDHRRHLLDSDLRFRHRATYHHLRHRATNICGLRPADQTNRFRPQVADLCIFQRDVKRDQFNSCLSTTAEVYKQVGLPAR